MRFPASGHLWELPPFRADWRGKPPRAAGRPPSAAAGRPPPPPFRRRVKRNPSSHRSQPRPRRRCRKERPRRTDTITERREKKKASYAPPPTCLFFFSSFCNGARRLRCRVRFRRRLGRRLHRRPTASSAKNPLPLVGVFCLRRRLRAGGGLSRCSNPAPHPQPPHRASFPPPLFCRRLTPPTKKER